MADRVLASILLLAAIGYTTIAFTIIKAPFQYDPLGPETWPRVIGILSILCSAYIMAKPEVASLGTNTRTAIRLVTLVVLLSGYAWLYRPLGFIPSTWMFCTALCIQLGGRPVTAVLFGAVTGIGGYAVCTGLLDLNLPLGILATIL